MTRIKQNIFSKFYIQEVLDDVVSGNVSPYLRNEPFPYLERYPVGESIITIDNEFILTLPQGTENFDIDNSISLYQEYSTLNETQASDARLWVYLTHVRFWDYMRKRWPAEKFEDDKMEDYDKDKLLNQQAEFILWRYHLKTPNRRRLLRNGISRLWWYAHLTHDSKKSDPFELTRVLLTHQDKAQNLLERSLGSNTKVLKTILEYLKNNPHMSREEVREAIKEINLVGGVKNLHLLNEAELISII